MVYAESASSLACRARGAIDARHRHSWRYHYRWYRQRGVYRRRGNRGRAYRRRWRQAGSCSARDRRHGAVGDARLGRRAHALRWAGDVGPAAWAFVLARRDHRDVRQLRRRLRSVRPQHRGALMELMEGVEEIPGVVLDDGLTWEWESFPDFLDALERRPRAIDIAAQIAHHPLRVYVMGDRAIQLKAASAEDIAEMRRLTIEALRAGAFGFTTSRTDSHKTPVGEMVPSRYAGSEELLGIGSALGAVGAGAFGMNSDFDDEAEELAWMTRLAKETGRPVWFLLTDRYEDPERWRRLLAAVHAARAEGAHLTAQIAGRPIGVMLGIGTALNPFSVRPSYRQLDGLSIAEQRQRLRDPALRRKILDEKPSEEEVSRLAQFRQLITTRWDKFFVMGDPPDYEPIE